MTFFCLKLQIYVSPRLIHNPLAQNKSCKRLNASLVNSYKASCLLFIKMLVLSENCKPQKIEPLFLSRQSNKSNRAMVPK